MISGLHNVQVYDDGTQPVNIVPGALPLIGGAAGGIINDSNNRIYRGWDPNPVPNTFARDRVEVVHFANPGTYLVICGVRNHFVNDNMYGFVRVLPGKNNFKTVRGGVRLPLSFYGWATVSIRKRGGASAQQSCADETGRYMPISAGIASSRNPLFSISRK